MFISLNVSCAHGHVTAQQGREKLIQSLTLPITQLNAPEIVLTCKCPRRIVLCTDTEDENVSSLPCWITQSLGIICVAVLIMTLTHMAIALLLSLGKDNQAVGVVDRGCRCRQVFARTAIVIIEGCWFDITVSYGL